MVVKSKSKSSSKKMAAKKSKPVLKAVKKKVNGRVATTAKKLPSVIKEPMKKSAVLNLITETTGVAKKEVSLVAETLFAIGELALKKGGAGHFVWPGVMKMMVVRKPATKARKGINPFTGEEVMFKAKPARNVVKIRPLKKLKDAVQ